MMHLPRQPILQNLYQLPCPKGFRVAMLWPRFFQKTFGTLREQYLKVNPKYPCRISITAPAKHMLLIV
jgi:hypothetical protein